MPTVTLTPEQRVSAMRETLSAPSFDATERVTRSTGRAALTPEDRAEAATDLLSSYDEADQRGFAGCAVKAVAEGSQRFRVITAGSVAVTRFEPDAAKAFANAISAAAELRGLVNVRAVARKPVGMSASTTREVYVYVSGAVSRITAMPSRNAAQYLRTLRESGSARLSATA